MVPEEPQQGSQSGETVSVVESLAALADPEQVAPEQATELLREQLRQNEVIQNVNEALSQLQGLIEAQLPKSREKAMVHTKIDEAELWLWSMFDPSAEQLRDHPSVAPAPTEPPGDGPEIWLPPEAGEVVVPELELVEGGKQPDPPADETGEPA